MSKKLIFCYFIIIFLSISLSWYVESTNDIVSNEETINSNSDDFKFTGERYDDVEYPSLAIRMMTDSAYTFTDANYIHDQSLSLDGDFSILVIEDGLTTNEWLALEQNSQTQLDIIGCVGFSENQEITWTIDPVDSPDTTLPYSTGHHALHTISMLGSIAHGANIIMMDTKTTKHDEDDEDCEGDDFGFEFDDREMWEWIWKFREDYNIKIISFAAALKIDLKDNAVIKNYMEYLRADNVYMFCAAGNSDNHNNKNEEDQKYYKYPSIYTEWASIGSVNHEGSREGLRTTEYHDGWGSSYYTNEDYGDNDQGVKWIMPGNGVPVLSYSISDQEVVWIYNSGTSFSTPYMAGVAAMVIDQYYEGSDFVNMPTIDEIEEILIGASSRKDDYDYKEGWGYVNVEDALKNAYDSGYESNPTVILASSSITQLEADNEDVKVSSHMKIYVHKSGDYTIFNKYQREFEGFYITFRYESIYLNKGEYTILDYDFYTGNEGDIVRVRWSISSSDTHDIHDESIILELSPPPDILAITLTQVEAYNEDVEVSADVSIYSYRSGNYYIYIEYQLGDGEWNIIKKGIENFNKGIKIIENDNFYIGREGDEVTVRCRIYSSDVNTFYDSHLEYILLEVS